MARFNITMDKYRERTIKGNIKDFVCYACQDKGLKYGAYFCTINKHIYCMKCMHEKGGCQHPYDHEDIFCKRMEFARDDDRVR